MIFDFFIDSLASFNLKGSMSLNALKLQYPCLNLCLECIRVHYKTMRKQLCFSDNDKNLIF